MSFLSRSKSTRDARPARLPRDQRPENSHRYAVDPLPARTITAISSGKQTTTMTTTTTSSSSTGDSTMRKLVRRRSFTSTHNAHTSRIFLGLPEVFEPKATTPTTEADRKRRSSMFFGPPPRPLLAKPLKHAASPPPPPPKLSAFPPRKSSRVAQNPAQEVIVLPALPSVSPREVGVAVGDENIGMALGTPSGLLDSALVTAPGVVDAGPWRTNTPPGFVLPSEPFGVQIKVGRKGEQRPGSASDKGSEKETGTGWRGMLRRFGTKKKRPSTPERPQQQKRRVAPEKARKTGKKSTPFLDVDIPSVEMERYSVMFGTLLQPSEKSSIFARRKSKDANIISPEILIPEGAPLPPSYPPPSPPLSAPPTPLLPIAYSPPTAASPIRRSLTTSSVRARAPSPFLVPGDAIEPRSPLSRLSDDLRQTSIDLQRSPSPSLERIGSYRSPSSAAASGLRRSVSTSAAERSPARRGPSPVPSPLSAELLHHRPRTAETPTPTPTPTPAATTITASASTASTASTASSSLPALSPPPLVHARTTDRAAADDLSRSSSKMSRISKISEESSIATPRGSFENGDDDRWMAKPSAASSSDNEGEEDDGVPEPAWEMVKGRPLPALPPLPPHDGDGHGEGGEGDAEGEGDGGDMVHAAQVSIARQISLSQRQLLIPIVPRSQRLVSRKSIRDAQHHTAAAAAVPYRDQPMKARLVEHRTSRVVRKPEAVEWATDGVVEI